MGAFFYRDIYDIYFKPQPNYFVNSLCFITPPGHPYSSIEKLLWPFQSTVWFLILSIIVATFILLKIMHIIKHKNYTSQFITYYTGLDFLRFYLGLDVSRNYEQYIPVITKLFFILIAFSTIILRNMYQGSLFKYLTLSRNYSSINTIQDMINANLTFYIDEQKSFVLDVIPEIQSR